MGLYILQSLRYSNAVQHSFYLSLLALYTELFFFFKFPFLSL